MPLTPASDSLRADHREIEVHLDSLLALLLTLSAEAVPQLRREFQEIQRISALHFDKEEQVLYPRLRGSMPDLLARLDEQHEHSREIERHLEEVLSGEAGARRLTELRRSGIEFHDTIQHHIVEEEDHLLRVADRELSEAEQVELESRMRALTRR